MNALTKNILMIFLLVSILSNGQNNYYNKEHKNKIKKLDEMLGTWEGSGWAMNQETRQEEEFAKKIIST